MRIKTIAAVGLIVLFLLTATVVLLVFVIFPRSNLNNRSIGLPPHYQTNAYGETYGSLSDATAVGTEPDLIEAWGMDGVTLGYIRKTDMDLPEPKTPEEALAQNDLYPNGRRIPLYTVDGRTKIGEFEISNGSASSSVAVAATDGP